ncbi:MAG: thiamine biosynthesis lipoprotein [Halioglobus sp.]|jgi:thiamine biosynthesis lipoprotein
MRPQENELRLRVLGSACHISLGGNIANSDELLALAKTELQRLEFKFDAFYSKSIVGQINSGAGKADLISLDGEARSLFDFTNALWEQSNHQFDPTVAIIGNARSRSSKGPASLADKLAMVGWSRLELTPQGARLPTKGMLINLNSCVRPYAVDSVRRIFAKEGVKSAMISLDHDVATIGRQHDGANWLVGIKHPKGSGVAITRMKLNNKGYSVRGDFEHCKMIDSERYGSALSPVDGRPIPGLLSVGVMADTCLAACGAASIAHIKTEQAALRWLEQLGFPWVAVDMKLQCHGLLR